MIVGFAGLGYIDTSELVPCFDSCSAASEPVGHCGHTWGHSCKGNHFGVAAVVEDADEHFGASY